MHKHLHLAHGVVVLQTIVLLANSGYVGTPAEPTSAAYASYVT